ncbi:hypothetical protein GVAV_002886 [Gurleya vavrai]
MSNDENLANLEYGLAELNSMVREKYDADISNFVEQKGVFTTLVTDKIIDLFKNLHENFQVLINTAKMVIQ